VTRCKCYWWNKKWRDAIDKWICVHWWQRAERNKKWWDKCLYLNPWSQDIALHFNSFALHLFRMCASGNHVLYFIYELYYALEPLVCNWMDYDGLIISMIFIIIDGSCALGWWGYYFWNMLYNGYMKITCLIDPQNMVSSSLLLNLLVHSLNDQIFCMHLSRGSFILNWVLIAFIFLKLIAYMLLKLISESSLYLEYFNITSLCCHQLPKGGRLKFLGPYLCFGLTSFWTNKFTEMVIVLLKIRKRFSRRCCLWMTQGKGILIGFSILLVKVISGEMIGLLE
jgi:hypothetical protein